MPLGVILLQKLFVSMQRSPNFHQGAVGVARDSLLRSQDAEHSAAAEKRLEINAESSREVRDYRVRLRLLVADPLEQLQTKRSAAGAAFTSGAIAAGSGVRS